MPTPSEIPDAAIVAKVDQPVANLAPATPDPPMRRIELQRRIASLKANVDHAVAARYALIDSTGEWPMWKIAIGEDVLKIFERLGTL